MNFTSPNTRKDSQLTAIEPFGSWSKCLNTDHTRHVCAKYMFSWTPTPSDSQDSAVVSDTTQSTVGKWASVPERYLSKFEQEVF